MSPSKKFLRDTRALTTIEWALIAMVIALPAAHYMPAIEAKIAEIARSQFDLLNKPAQCQPGGAPLAPGTQLVC